MAVAIELTDATSTQTARISLNSKGLTDYSVDSAAVVLNQQAYWLRLLAVDPYPSTTPGSRVQTATLRLRPR